MYALIYTDSHGQPIKALTFDKKGEALIRQVLDDNTLAVVPITPYVALPQAVMTTTGSLTHLPRSLYRTRCGRWIDVWRRAPKGAEACQRCLGYAS